MNKFLFIENDFFPRLIKKEIFVVALNTRSIKAHRRSDVKVLIKQ